MDADKEIMELVDKLTKEGLDAEAMYVHMLTVFRKSPAGMKEIKDMLFNILVDAHMKANPVLTKKILREAASLAQDGRTKQ